MGATPMMYIVGAQKMSLNETVLLSVSLKIKKSY